VRPATEEHIIAANIFRHSRWASLRDETTSGQPVAVPEFLKLSVTEHAADIGIAQPDIVEDIFKCCACRGGR
jgi:hypothetical protein